MDFGDPADWYVIFRMCVEGTKATIRYGRKAWSKWKQRKTRKSL